MKEVGGGKAIKQVICNKSPHFIQIIGQSAHKSVILITVCINIVECRAAITVTAQ